jgi:DNA-binding response OmpR family regulator
VLRAIRAAPRTAGLPVVVLTGEQQEGVEVAVMDEGADDYIRKPIEPARFVARIKAALRRAAS